MNSALVGTHVKVTPRQQPLEDLVQAYKASPEAFQRQFGRPVQDAEIVLDVARSGQTHGFSSYFDVQLREDDTVIGHLRVDWSLREEGLICLHGGSPLDDPTSPGHRRRAHARARHEAWLLMVRAALATPGVERVGTATAVSNRAAQAFIAASGFRRTRLLQLPDGRETMIHYRLVRQWFETALGPQVSTLAACDEGLGTYRPPTAMAPLQEATADPPPADRQQPMAAPSGWTRIGATEAPGWIDAAPTDFLRGLADTSAEGSTREDVVHTLFFEAAHGTQFFGLAERGQPAPAQALIAVQPLPRRPGWWMLRGGPLHPQPPPSTLRSWLDTCFTQDALRRVEAHVPTRQAANGLAWWRDCGLTEEGIAEIDSQGQPLAYALARVAA
ncbi:MAG: hypothetical protein RL522_1590 [Pseudomonadota bacterium]|jgi:RimJ/RimL family protein N-acetyltransferase